MEVPFIKRIYTQIPTPSNSQSSELNKKDESELKDLM